MGQQKFDTNEGNPLSHRSSLIINKQQKAPLTKEQQTFNRLIKKIEKLQAELENTAHSLQQKLTFYGKNIYPLEQRQIALHKDLTRSLYKFFQDNKLFSKNDKAILGEIISMQLHALFQLEQTEPDNEFKEIFKDVEKVDYDEAAGEELDTMKQEMQSMFDEMGVDIDLEEMNRSLTEEEIMQKIEDLQNQFRQQAAKKEQSPGRKTKRQLEKEAKERQAEETRLKSINSIYKQLVKLFHPDRELDPDMKPQKEELMKKLTTSYKSGDLHALLKLELQWILQDGNAVDKLTDDKLSLYNDSLKQQTIDLEEEINQLLCHPRYQPLHQFAATPHQIRYISFNEIKQQKKALITELTASIVSLQGPEKTALAELREIIYLFKNYR